MGFLQTGGFRVSELLRHPPQPVQPGQIHKAGLLGGWAGRGRGHLILIVIVITTIQISCLYVCHLRSSWKPMATLTIGLFLRKLFRSITIGLKRTTAGECLLAPSCLCCHGGIFRYCMHRLLILQKNRSATNGQTDSGQILLKANKALFCDNDVR